VTQVTLDLARNCLEGTIPAVIATCAADGTPNALTRCSVDAGHVADFSVLQPNASISQSQYRAVIDPVTSASLPATLYLRTSRRPAIQTMKARLAGIASTGMAGVFNCGADIYAVPLVEQIKATRARPACAQPAARCAAGSALAVRRPGRTVRSEPCRCWP
jgi:hypothetical protein